MTDVHPKELARRKEVSWRRKEQHKYDIAIKIQRLTNYWGENAREMPLYKQRELMDEINGLQKEFESIRLYVPNMVGVKDYTPLTPPDHVASI